MSADIQKESVFDDRIIQSRPKYAVEKGALSLTNAPFNSIASTSSQMTFNIYVPSENVFVDRALRWSGTAYFQMNASYPAGTTMDTTQPVVVIGQDCALAPFPLNYMCQTMTATINDTTSVINSQDVLSEVLRLTDYKKNLTQRTCPTKLDKYQWNGTGLRCNNDPMGGYSEAMNTDEVPNGAWSGMYFTNPAGAPLVGDGTYTYPTGGQVYQYKNGVPMCLAGVTNYPIFWALRSTEKLVLSPFVFADDCEQDTGLFGINNIQIIMNFKSAGGTGLGDIGRILRTRSNTGPTGSGTTVNVPISPVQISGINWNTGASGGVWSKSVLNVQFLTPSLDVPLPAKSVVPYMEFPRYITQQQNGTIPAGAVQQLQSQTITLPQIPDLLIVYVKATQATGFPDPTTSEYADCYLPLASSFNSQVNNPLSINFDNFSGLLSSHTTEELYQMSISNGLEMDWNTWCGQTRANNAVPAGTAMDNSVSPPAFANPALVQGAMRATTGGFLVLKPSKDITLQAGQAPSLVGNFTLQFNLQVVNTFGFTVQPSLFVITANSGFFESIRGSSRIIKGVLSEQDIISAPMSGAGTHEGMKRLVGGKISFGSMSNIFNKAKEYYEKSKPVVSGIKNMLGDEGVSGKVKGALGAVGYGTGAGKGRKGLSARLM